MFIVGYAYQAGLIPITSNSIEKAIKLNNVSVELNLNAFKLGRGTYLKKNEILESINLSKELNGSQKISLNYEEIKKRRFNYLIKYQNKKYAEKYLELVNLIENSEKKLSKSNNFLSKSVAINYFKLMAYKDEYEVSRLYTDPQFMNNINENFEGDFKIHYHMAPPIFSKKDPVKGNPTKVSLGPWLFTLMKIISSFKFLRGTVFDPFGYLKERKEERNLIKDYYNCMNNISINLNLNNYKIACEIASVPEKIRGFGYVKEKNIIISKNLEKELLKKFN